METLPRETSHRSFRRNVCVRWTRRVFRRVYWSYGGNCFGNIKTFERTRPFLAKYLRLWILLHSIIIIWARYRLYLTKQLTIFVRSEIGPLCYRKCLFSVLFPTARIIIYLIVCDTICLEIMLAIIEQLFYIFLFPFSWRIFFFLLHYNFLNTLHFTTCFKLKHQI